MNFRQRLRRAFYVTFRDLSIKTKLFLLVLMTSALALLVATFAFVSNDVRMIKASMVQQLSSLADVLGSNSTAALTFDDPEAARQLLTSLRLQPMVASGCIYNANDKMFASWNSTKVASIRRQPGLRDGYVFTDDGFLDVAKPLVQEGNVLGTIYLHATMRELRDQLLTYILIAVGVSALALVASLLVSLRLQRGISRPILNLADVAQRISTSRDYSLRVTHDAQDELGSLYKQFNAMLEQIQTGETALQQAQANLELKVEHRTHQLSDAVAGLNREIAQRTRAEHELETVHRQLLDTARRAGMAEIATAVLHNVGNVLNSINVSATLVVDRLRHSRLNQLNRAMNLMQEHTKDLSTFLVKDEKGRKLPEFLALVANELNSEHTELGSELRLLMEKVDHVKVVVSAQQSYTGVAGLIEAFDVAAALDDALKLNSASFDRHRITVERDYAELPRVRMDRQKLLQILINLVKNAKESLLEKEDSARILSFRTALAEPNRLRIEVRDNGVGVAPEHMTRIFSYGFTTKPSGHGFGLHSCANAAMQLDGSLSVDSNGVGTGATFTLDLPFMPVSS